MNHLRAWRPTSKYVRGTNVLTSVEFWEWDRRNGLRVVYKYADGEYFKSGWNTLPEFLKAVREGREGPVEEITC